MILFYFGTVRSTPDGLMAVLCLPADTVRNLPRRASDQRQSSLPPPSVAPAKTPLPAPPHCRGCAAPGPIHKDSPSSRSGGGSTFNPHNSKRKPSKCCFCGELAAPHRYVRHQPTGSLGAPPPRGVLLPIANRLAQNKNSDN